MAGFRCAVWVVIMIYMVYYISNNNGCLEEERIGLLGLRELLESNGADSAKYLPSWGLKRNCCEWERVTCDPTTGHVTELFLHNFNVYKDYEIEFHVWTINCSLFLPFRDLRTLNLSTNSFGKWNNHHGFERLSALKKLEKIDISHNNFDNTILKSLGAVTSLKALLLSSNRLGDSFPAHGFEKLSLFRKLETLDLSYNSWTVEALPFFNSFTSLKVLNLCGNLFWGSFPAQELGDLRDLESLDLSFNLLTGIHGLESLARFKNLTSLDLSYNEFNRSLFLSLSPVTSLKNLFLSSAYEEDTFPARELSVLENMEMLDLRHNGLSSFTEEDCELLSKLSKMRHLDLSSNRFDKGAFRILGALPSLRFLSLSYNNLEGSISNQDLTSNHSSLEVLILNRNKLTGSLPVKGLSVLKNLEMLDLSYNGFSSLTTQDCEILSKLSKMRHLDLSFNRFDKGVFRILGALPSLRFLSLSYNNLEGSISNQDLTHNHSSLEVLLLNENRLNGLLPVEGLASFRFLEVLDLSQNSFFGGIPSSIRNLSSLKVLSLADNNLEGYLPDQGLCELQKLEELDLGSASLNGALPLCLSNLKCLRVLDLSGNQFTGNLSASLVSSVSLEYIDLSRNLLEGTFSLSSLVNHSNLVVLDISSDNGKLVVETEDVDWFPMFQLEVLFLINCNLNRLSNKILPKFLIHQHKLRDLDLSHNNLNDLFPNWLLVNNTRLEFFNVRSNSLSGTFYLPSVQNPQTLDCSDNQLSGKIQSNIGNVFPSVYNLNLSNNAFEGSIPSSLGVMSVLRTLDLSSNRLSGEAPWQSFGNCTTLDYLSLSNNSLHGQIYSSDFNFTQLQVLQLGDNQFAGPLPATFLGSGLKYLDVSDNNLSGEVSGEFPRWMETVILSNNSFDGEFPCSLVPRTFMDISYNSFSGPISSCSNQNLEIVNHLHLQGNKFTGPIPQGFLNSSALLTLDINDNLFSGTIPMFLAPKLRIFLAKGNLLHGSIPSHLCRLNQISLMDLSNNLFIGSIPRCLTNISFESFVPFVEYPIRSHSDLNFYIYEGILQYVFGNYGESFMYGKRKEVNFVTKGHTYSYRLNAMSGLDLSCNNLTGEIPREIGYLSAIRAMNLSHNHLTGPIPKTLSNLKQVESLDLSYNNLGGNIPFELTNLFSLAVFSVANNNLSGIIPNGKAQFDSFDASCYEGNPGLCGKPLKKSCNTIHGKEIVPRDYSDKRESKWFGVDRVVVAVFGISYFTFFVAALTVLYINPNWRNRCYDLLAESFYSTYFYFSKLCR